MPRLETMSTTGFPVAGLITVFFCKFGIWRRFDLTFEWLTLFPVSGVLPVIMQTLLIKVLGFRMTECYLNPKNLANLSGGQGWELVLKLYTYLFANISEIICKIR